MNFPGTADDITTNYDALGRIQSQLFPGTSTTFAYESATGRLASRTDVVNGITHVSSYTYDLNDNLKTLTYPSGRVVTYDYDNEHRLTQVNQNGQLFAHAFAYDDRGRLRGRKPIPDGRDQLWVAISILCVELNMLDNVERLETEADQS